MSQVPQAIMQAYSKQKHPLSATHTTAEKDHLQRATIQIAWRVQATPTFSHVTKWSILIGSDQQPHFGVGTKKYVDIHNKTLEPTSHKPASFRYTTTNAREPTRSAAGGQPNNQKDHLGNPRFSLAPTRGPIS